MYTRYTKEILEPIVKSSKTYAECLEKLGIKKTGGNYKNLQKNIDKFNIDISHMVHKSINQGREFKKYEELTTNDSIKKRLILERGHKCECCGLEHWLELPITIELEHINGDNRDNSKENLKLLCPNCHSQTPTWRNRKRK